MGKRSTVPFDVFAMQEKVQVSSLVRDGDLGWTCGQCPLDRDGGVIAPGDLLAQAKFVRDMIETVVKRGGFAPDAIRKLNVYFAAEDPAEGAATLAFFRAAFPSRPVIVPIAVPHFYYDGMQIEVDVFARPGAHARKLKDAGSSSLQIVDAGETIWASARSDLSGGRDPSEALEEMNSILEAEGLLARDLISDQWFLPIGEGRSTLDFECLTGADLVSIPDVAVCIDPKQTNALIADLTFSAHPATATSETSEGGKLKIVRRGDGKVLTVTASYAAPKADLVEQTTAIMSGIEDALGSESLSFADVAKVTAHYVGGATPEELHGNMKVRHSYYESPGPASTGLPVSALLNPDCRIAISVIATR